MTLTLHRRSILCQNWLVIYRYCLNTKKYVTFPQPCLLLAYTTYIDYSNFLTNGWRRASCHFLAQMTALGFFNNRMLQKSRSTDQLACSDSLWSRYQTHAVFKQITSTLIYPIHISLLAPSLPRSGSSHQAQTTKLPFSLYNKISE